MCPVNSISFFQNETFLATNAASIVWIPNVSLRRDSYLILSPIHPVTVAQSHLKWLLFSIAPRLLQYAWQPNSCFLLLCLRVGMKGPSWAWDWLFRSYQWLISALISFDTKPRGTNWYDNIFPFVSENRVISCVHPLSQRCSLEFVRFRCRFRSISTRPFAISVCPFPEWPTQSIINP